MIQNSPYIKVDANGRQIQSSSSDMAFRGDEDGGTNLIYVAFARPGTLTSKAAWQISKLAYSGNNNVTSITWPQDVNGNASSEYNFVWNDRASYTYS